MGSAPPLHVVVFPFMAQGHTLPMLDLSKLLARCELRGPLGVENTVDLPSEDLCAPFIEAIKKLKEPFEEILRGMFEAGCPPIGVILDFFLGWTLDSCNSFGIPRIVTYGMSALSQAILITSGFHTQYILASLPEDPVQFPELPTPFQADLNSFEDIEREHIAALESLYSTEAKAWCVGPLLLCDQIKEEEDTKAHVTDEQLDEIALGLEMAMHPFIWEVKSRNWVAPKGWKRVKERGLIVRSWVEQPRILAHPKTGGFLSHCGWNFFGELVNGGATAGLANRS
ncbi:UDP-glycosyltransferase 90A1 [Vitis vinifera]|uniref:UDP-glycosyltransferase 90A1 n=1 Tax=Vitis vinifera TaxID=29760 RepID=UPI00053FAE62|nr:UDP-glycosyltransferase 90A1 [Vitis vinifera]|eukprot:XP_010655191.1 PREDICTED: UDP-glycosyltransferase 90A1-like [Vitis vinifera]